MRIGWRLARVILVSIALLTTVGASAQTVLSPPVMYRLEPDGGDPTLPTVVSVRVSRDGSRAIANVVTPTGARPTEIDLTSIAGLPLNYEVRARVIVLDPVAGELVEPGVATTVQALSGDGGVVMYRDASGTGYARESGASTAIPAPPAPWTSAQVTESSEDGRYVAGRVLGPASAAQGFRFDRWTTTWDILSPILQAPVMIPWPPSGVDGMSADGVTMTGVAGGLGGTTAAVFDVAELHLVEIDDEPVPTFSFPLAIGAQGRKVVGHMGGAVDDYFLHADGVLSYPFTDFAPAVVTKNGRRMGGTHTALGGAAYWTQETGTLLLEDVLLSAYGIDSGFPGMASIASMSDDGLTMVGIGQSQPTELWIVQLDQPIEIATPEPGLAAGIALGSALLAGLGAESRRRGARRSR